MGTLQIQENVIIFLQNTSLFPHIIDLKNRTNMQLSTGVVLQKKRSLLYNFSHRSHRYFMNL